MVRISVASTSTSSYLSIVALFVANRCVLTPQLTIICYYRLILSIYVCYCSLELSGRQLTNVTASGSGSTLSFAFYSDGTVVSELSASELAQEKTLFLQNNSLSSIPASLFQTASSLTSM